MQLRIEKYFRATRRLGSIYWTGLIKNDNLYYWPDGSVVNNGATSNANPYAHFPYNYQDRLAAYPTFIYTLAHTSWSYGTYTGVWQTAICNSDLQTRPASEHASTSATATATGCTGSCKVALAQASDFAHFSKARLIGGAVAGAGNSSYLQMQTSTYYIDNANTTYAWQAYPATQTAPFICEVGHSQSALVLLRRSHCLA